MKVHKITLMVIDHDNLGNKIIDYIEKCQDLPFGMDVIRLESEEIGELSEYHPLDFTTFKETFEYIFPTDYNQAIEEAAERVRGCFYMDAYSQNELAKDIEDLKR